MSCLITVDGTSASGKSSLAAALAEHLSYDHLSTGKIYRLLALRLLELGIASTEIDEIVSVALGMKGDLANLEDPDLSTKLKAEEVAEVASKIATVPAVREALLVLQRGYADERTLVADGRDSGSVVFVDARYKFYVTADLSVRAIRRLKDSVDSGDDNNALLNRVIESLRIRDERDMNRDVAPLIVPEGAFIIDSTYLDMKKTLDLALHCIAGRC